MNLPERYLKYIPNHSNFDDFNPFGEKHIKLNRGKNKKEFINIKNQ